MKIYIIIILSALLSSCLIPLIPPAPPGQNSVGLYSEYSKNKTVEQVKAQMLVCGFPGNDPMEIYSRVMTKVDYFKSNICMEQNGFRSYKNKSTCHNKWLVSTGGQETEQLCQAWLKEFKR